MKLIREHINFERNIDPKDAMRTGHIAAQKIEKIKQLLKQNNFKGTFEDKIDTETTFILKCFSVYKNNHNTQQVFTIKFDNDLLPRYEMTFSGGVYTAFDTEIELVNYIDRQNKIDKESIFNTAAEDEIKDKSFLQLKEILKKEGFILRLKDEYLLCIAPSSSYRENYTTSIRDAMKQLGLNKNFSLKSDFSSKNHMQWIIKPK